MVTLAFIALADFENAMRLAGKEDPKSFDDLWSLYNAATHFSFSSNSIDMVSACLYALNGEAQSHGPSEHACQRLIKSLAPS